MSITVDPRRIRPLNSLSQKTNGPVIYWMSRDQRVRDNWALLYAKECADREKVPLIVIFCIGVTRHKITERHLAFMVQGLQECERELQSLGIGFVCVPGNPATEIPRFCEEFHASHLVCDFSPLRTSRERKIHAAKHISCPAFEVDTHNIVPCWLASDKQEFAAKTLRPKIHALLPEFLTDIPELKKHIYPTPHGSRPVDWHAVVRTLPIDRTVKPGEILKPGEKEAQALLKHFLTEKLALYSRDRNNPTLHGQSGFSPYLHFGQISAQRIAYEVKHLADKNPNLAESTEAFLEELIVRKELSDNFCFYNPHYDSDRGAPAWANKTLTDHQSDRREYLYNYDTFAQAKTHDPLWNAAQLEMVKTGKMHGYMRMYWAKKILEWTLTPAEAIQIAIRLNDTYELDGKDPNGYVGILWSIAGLHDRPWFNRPIFGLVRTMTYSGMKKKFDTQQYIDTMNAINTEQ